MTVIYTRTETDTDGIRMFDVLTMYDLTQHCFVPILRSGHTLDLIITRCNHEVLLSNPVADYIVSDHMFARYQVNMSRPPLKACKISYWKLKHIDNTAFGADLKRLGQSTAEC